MFVDQITISVKAGKGGNGIVAYRRELKVPLGGPAGGRGGKGGDIIFVGKSGLTTLLDFRYQRHVTGLDGENGMHKGMTGAKAENTYISVPLGTSVFDANTNKVICDITKDKQEVIICKGGRGGRGNIDFATHDNPCPSICEKGEPGEEREVRLELRVLADCGLVGFPSVGKSTLISAISKAKPKIAEYHFTTLVPNLGMVYVPDGKSFVMADLPGLIEGASLGAGLGIEFLKHIERCRVIVHIIDMASTEGRNPYEDYLAIRHELENYKLELKDRPEIIVANKMDMPEAKENLKEFKTHFSSDTKIYEISAYTKEGTQELIYAISQLIEATPSFALFENTETEVLYQFREEKEPFIITKDSDGIYNVTGDKLKKLFLMTDFNQEDAVKRFARQLRSLGLDDALRKRGVQDHDTVRIFDYEFEYYE